MAETKTTKATEQAERLERKRNPRANFGTSIERARKMGRDFFIRECHCRSMTGERRAKKVPAAQCPQCVHDMIVKAWAMGARYERQRHEPTMGWTGTHIIAEGPEKHSTDAEVSVEEAKRLRDLGLIKWERSVGFFVCAKGKTMADLARVSEEIRDSVMEHASGDATDFPDDPDDEPDTWLN